MPTIDRSIGLYHDSSASHLRKIASYIGPASYVSGGDRFDAADLGMGRVEHVLFGLATNGVLYRTLVYVPASVDGTRGFVRWIDSTNGIEVGAGANLSGYTARFEAIGR